MIPGFVTRELTHGSPRAISLSRSVAYHRPNNKAVTITPPYTKYFEISANSTLLSLIHIFPKLSNSLNITLYT